MESTKKFAAFLSLVVINVALSLLITLSKRDDHSYDYNPASAITLAEGAKLAVSIVAYTRETTDRGHLNISLRFVMSYLLLALIYCLNNQLTFAILRLTNPGNLTLFKSTTPFLTAILQLIIFGVPLTKLRWTSVLILSVGLLMSQWNERTTSVNIGLEACLALFASVILTSISSVVNAHTIKAFSNTPLTLHNSVLYFFGVIFNTNAYALGKAGAIPTNSDASFFEGYNNVYAILVILLNSLIGIIITLLYKYGDAVVKCFAQVISSIVLIVISFLFFEYNLSVNSSCGCLLVFVATYLYILLSPELEGDDVPNRGRIEGHKTAHVIEEKELLIKHVESDDLDSV